MTEFNLAGKHLVIGIPAFDNKVPIDLMISYIKTTQLLQRHGVKCTLETKGGCALIDKARSELVHVFRENKEATDFLFIDADIGWEPESVLRLLSWGTLPDKDIVVGMYPTKKDEIEFLAILEPSDQDTIKQDEYGLIAAKAVPTGFMLIQRSVFARMESCYYELQYSPRKGEFKDQLLYNFFHHIMEDDTLYGEDISFCKRALESGSKIWIDPDIELRHHGAKVFTYNYGKYLLGRGNACPTEQS